MQPSPVGTWNVVVSSAQAEGQAGSVVLRFESDRSPGKLIVGCAVDHTGEVKLERVEFDPSSATLRFEQRGPPGHPKVVWLCKVAGDTFDAGKITENYRVVAYFQGRKKQQIALKQSQPQQPAEGGYAATALASEDGLRPTSTSTGQMRNLCRFPSKLAARQTRAALEQTEGSAPTLQSRNPSVVAALTDAQLLVNLDRDHGLAAGIFPFTLDDAEARDLPDHEIDKLIALKLFQAIVYRELVGGVPPSLLQLQQRIVDTEAIMDDEFQAWLAESHSRMAMFADVIESIRLQWASKEDVEAGPAERAAISRVEEGGVLAMYMANGRKKDDRYFAVSGDTYTMTWSNPANTAGPKGSSWRLSGAREAPKTMELLEIQKSIQSRSAQEWFAAVDTDGDGMLDSSQLSTLYLRARGEPLSAKQLKAAMKVMDPDGRGAINCTDFARWWTDNSSDLDKHRELAFTVTVHQPVSTDERGKFQLILVAPNRDAKEMWVKGLTVLCKRKQKLDSEREEAALVEAKKRFTRSQVRNMVRAHLQREQRDPNVSDAWIDGLFVQFAVGQAKTIDAAAWHSLVGQLEHTKMLNRAQVRHMVSLQLQVDGRILQAESTTEDGDATLTDGCIDSLFGQVDADSSGVIDEREWEQLLLLVEKQSVWLM